MQKPSKNFGHGPSYQANLDNLPLVIYLPWCRGAIRAASGGMEENRKKKNPLIMARTEIYLTRIHKCR